MSVCGFFLFRLYKCTLIFISNHIHRRDALQELAPSSNELQSKSGNSDEQSYDAQNENINISPRPSTNSKTKDYEKSMSRTAEKSKEGK